MNPFLIYASGIAIVAGFAAGWSIRDWKADAAALKAYEKTEAVRDKMQGKIDANATSFEDFRAGIEPKRYETRNTLREIYHEAPPVAASCAVPVGAVSLLEDTRHRANAAASGKLGEGMPGTSSDSGASR